MKEIHLTKKDFKVSWYSGQGAGGQHRNKSSNCCRITHVGSGLTSQGTSSRSRVVNQKEAFHKLAKMIIALDFTEKERGENTPSIRTYHGVRNVVHDKASGLREPYKHVVLGSNMTNMISARRLALLNSEN